MNLTARHRQPIPTARILCTVMIAVMLAQPVVAALPTVTGCNGGCCCCPTPDHDVSVKIRAYRSNSMDCCGSENAAPACHMSAMDRSDALPALIRSATQTPSDPGHLIPAASHATVRPPSAIPSAAWADTGPQASSTRLYLRTCRILC